MSRRGDVAAGRVGNEKGAVPSRSRPLAFQSERNVLSAALHRHAGD